MRTKYQRVFDHVAASDRLKEEVRNMTRQEKRTVRRQVPRALIAAALVALLLAGTALAASVPGIQDWFRQYWQEATGQAEMDAAQAAAVDGLTQTVGSQAAGQEREEDVFTELPGAAGEETAPQAGPEDGTSAPADQAESAAGTEDAAEPPAAGTEDAAESPSAGTTAAASEVTVTVDSVTAGKTNLWILLRVSGKYEAGRYYAFETGRLEGAPQKELSDTVTFERGVMFSQDGSRVLENGSLEMLVRYECPDPNADMTESRSMTLVLENLTVDRGVLVAGRWELPITLSAMPTQPPIVLENVMASVIQIPMNEGVYRPVTYQKVQVTTGGMQITCAPEDVDDTLANYRNMALVLKSGAEIGADGGNGTRDGETEDSPWVLSFGWKLPVDLDQAAALRLGETLVPLT